MRNKKNKRRFFKRNKIGIIIVFILLSYLSITLIKQEMKLRELREEEKKVLAKIEEMDEQKEDLKKRIEESNDVKFIEKVAREKLKMVKPNEIIYVIQDEEKETGE